MPRIDEEFYRNEMPGLTASDIKLLWRSPAHYREHKLHPPEPTPAMEFGSAAHMAILEPERFIDMYASIDDAEICEKIGGAKPRATTRYKEWKADFLLDNPGKIILDTEDFDAITEMARDVREHPVAGRLFAEPGRVEEPLQWTHPGTGTHMKARPDLVTNPTDKLGKIVDIKTCQDARPTAFSRDMWNLLYHLQAAVYREGVEETTGALLPFVFIAVEKAPPYAIMVYQLDEHALELAESEVDRVIREYEYCFINDDWPAYRAEMRLIALPTWANVTEVA